MTFSAKILVPALCDASAPAGDSLDLRLPLVWTITNLLSAEECAALTARADAAGFEDAPITTAAGFVMRPDLRNNTRAILDDVELAALLFARSRESLPSTMFDRFDVFGANERFRLLPLSRGATVCAPFSMAHSCEAPRSAAF